MSRPKILVFTQMFSSESGNIWSCCLAPLYQICGPGSSVGIATELRARRAVLQIGRSLVRSQLVSLEFFIDIKSFRSHYGHGVDSASNRNEYQEHFLGVKAVGA